MSWERLLDTRRHGGDDDTPVAPRSAYQRDWDRILYSPHFRRLAGKTQVFPLPLDDHVHSRLTHSLEVATVGRSLGTLVGYRLPGSLPRGFEARDVGDCVAAACLAHDMGNPPFGHVGEDAIQEFARRLVSRGSTTSPTPSATTCSLRGQRRGAAARDPPAGTAVAARTRPERRDPRRPGQVPVLVARREEGCGQEPLKHGIDSPEVAMFAEVADVLGLGRDPRAHAAWRRHPLAFLTEAADDIAYQVIDLEDGLRLRHVTQPEFLGLMKPLCADDPRCPPLDPVRDRGGMLDLAARLRSIAINTLIRDAADVFATRLGAVLDGTFDEPLVAHIVHHEAVARITRTNVAACYSARDVLKLELTGSVAIQAVLGALVDAAVNTGSVRSGHLRRLLPRVFAGDDLYTIVLQLADFVAGMTDHYVVRLYRELSGIRLPGGRD